MIKKAVSIFRTHKIYSQATILFLVVSLGNVFSLLFHVFMARALSPEDYGILNTLFACILFFAMPTGNLQITLTRFVAHYCGMGSKSAVLRLLKGISGRILVLSCAISVSILLAAKLIGNYLHIPNLMPIYSIAGVVLTSIMMPVPLAGLQGLQNFNALGISMACMNIVKLLFAVIFIKIGFGVTGALNSITASNLLCLIFAVQILGKNFKDLKAEENYSLNVNFKEIYLYILPVSLATLSFVILTHVDLILVKHFFIPIEAGYYSIAQTVGKMVLFAPMAVCMVMFPKVANSHAKKEETLSYLKHSTLYIVALVILAASVLFFFPEMLLKLLTGKVYIQCLPLIRRYAFSMGLFAISFNFLLYFLSLNKTKYLMPFLAALLIETAIIYFWHSSLVQILNVVIAVSLGLLAVNIVIIKKIFLIELT
ncbi:MAG: oligosaccharide flippase family protein [Candidatus Omnitrophica bacterium]|nr:oligosaccharide flippase family protein [Candidatus Omnitrophota bacterium]